MRIILQLSACEATDEYVAQILHESNYTEPMTEEEQCAVSIDKYVNNHREH